MPKISNDDESPAIDNEFLHSYFKQKPADCTIYSENGVEFRVHKEILSQTKLMRNIIKVAFSQREFAFNKVHTSKI